MRDYGWSRLQRKMSDDYTQRKKGQKNVNRKRSNIESLGENNGQKEKYLPKSDQYLFSFFITHRTPQYYI